MSEGDDEAVGENFAIRPATNADAPKVQELVFNVLAEYGLSPDPGATDVDLRDLEGFYANRGGGFDVLVSPVGLVIGTVGLASLGGGRCELRKMYLAARYRDRGLGRGLLSHALRQAAELGFKRVELETAGVLQKAIGLYVSAGFQPFDSPHLSRRCDQAYYLDIE
jgi:putative acetyltransferase